MGLPHVTSFCWCMGLETGSKFIGFVHLVVSISLMIICSVFAESVRSNMGTVEDAGDQLYTRWYTVAVVAAVLTNLHVCLAVLLIYSVYKRVVKGLRLWVVIMSLLCAAALLYIVVELALYGVSEPGSGSEMFISFVEGAVFFTLVMYSILCVYSYYLMVRSAQDMLGTKTIY